MVNTTGNAKDLTACIGEREEAWLKRLAEVPVAETFEPGQSSETR